MKRALFVLLVLTPAAPAQETFAPFDRAAFEAHAVELGATDDQIAAFRTDAEEVSEGTAADELLRVLVPDYGRAVTLAEDGDPAAALRLAELLSGTEDAYLRAHARYHLGRVFLDGDDPERAADVFSEFLRDDRSRTPLDGEVVYFYGHSLAEIPRPDLAASTFTAFLRLFPNAPERYLASAQQQLAELESQAESPLHEIADVMKGVERRIRKTDTGEETQELQKNVMTQLAQIIEQIEEQEQQSAGAPSGLGRPQSPAGNSAAPPGQTRIGNLNRNSGVVDRWGALQDRDRADIESDLQTVLPGHYRRMLEEYYKKLGANQ